MAVEIEIDEIEDGIVIGRVITEGGHLEIMAEAILDGRRLTLRGLNVHGVGVWANQLGHVKLRKIVLETMEHIDVDELIVEGAIRITGAGPGRKPRPIRFTRKAPPAVRATPT
ncbi:hypothetical protein [Bradyrhizobium sp.]|uniref:hypothetical protein n=1 Tax=Bradyrhizobium sp. TaxID=376 RepID=UPI003C20FE5C